MRIFWYKNNENLILYQWKLLLSYSNLLLSVGLNQTVRMPPARLRYAIYWWCHGVLINICRECVVCHFKSQKNDRSSVLDEWCIRHPKKTISNATGSGLTNQYLSPAKITKKLANSTLCQRNGSFPTVVESIAVGGRSQPVVSNELEKSNAQ